jgi:translation elongation factor EF-G
MTVDAAGDLWVAIYGGGRVNRYAPDGSLRDVYPIPAPEDCARAVIDDLKLRRCQIIGQDTRDGVVGIDAMVPLMHMFGYAGPLRQKSNGRATFTMRFEHYATAPPNVTSDDDPPFRPAIGMRA